MDTIKSQFQFILNGVTLSFPWTVSDKKLYAACLNIVFSMRYDGNTNIPELNHVSDAAAAASSHHINTTADDTRN